MAINLFQVVKLDDAMKHEGKWAVLKVRLSARIVGTVAYAGVLSTHTTRAAALRAMDEAETEVTRAVTTCRAGSMCVGCCDPHCHKHTETCQDPMTCPVHYNRKED